MPVEAFFSEQQKNACFTCANDKIKEKNSSQIGALESDMLKFEEFSRRKNAFTSTKKTDFKLYELEDINTEANQSFNCARC